MSEQSVKKDTLSRKEQKIRTRQQIIDAAYEVFVRNGVTASNTQDIAQAAGVSHGTVFVHFPTRDDLVMRVIEEFGQRISSRMNDLAEAGSSVREVLKAHLKVLAEYEPFYAQLVSEGTLLPSGARNALIGIQSVVSLHLSEAARREVKEGNLKPMPSHMLFNGWIGLVHYYLVNRDLFAPKESIIAKRGEELLSYYMELIAK